MLYLQLCNSTNLQEQICMVLQCRVKHILFATANGMALGTVMLGTV